MWYVIKDAATGNKRRVWLTKSEVELWILTGEMARNA